jgi:taurine dioxygenase
MEVTPLTPHIGAEIRGIDLSEPLNNETFAGVHQAFLDWSVLVFPDQRLSRDQHKAFGRRFGKLHTHPMNYKGTDDPEVLMVKTTEDSAYTAGNGWHTDVTCDEYPPMGSMLYINQTPAGGGGDTLYADMYLAYQLLSAPMKAMLNGLVAVHDGAIPYVGSYKSTPPEGGYPKHEHPLITTHPETGRKVLYVNAGFTSHIKGLKSFESRALLSFLYEHIATTPRLTCRVQWRPNTLTFWDNRCTQHHAIWDYYPHSRYGERVSIIASERPAV